MRKTRKIISLIMVLSMVLSLSACGAIKLHSDKLDLRIKGNGKKALTLTVWGEFPENMEKEIRITSDDEGKDPFAVTVKKETNSKIVYQITGLKSCNSSLIIKYTVESEDYALINMPIGITSDLKVHCGSVILDGNDDFRQITGSESDDSDTSEKLDGEISATAGSSKLVKLNAGNGTWGIGSFDEEIISVSDEGYEDGYCNFFVSAQAVGVSDLILTNKDENKTLKLSFAVTEYKDENGEVTDLTLTLTDSQLGDNDGSDEYAQTLKNIQRALEGKFKSVYLSPNARIEDFILSKLSGEDVKVDYEAIYRLQEQIELGKFAQEDSENLQKRLDAIFATVDTADMQLKMDGHDVFYKITTAMDKDQLKSFMFEGLEFANEGLLNFGERVIDSCLTTDGFGAALWTEGENTCLLIFIEEMDETTVDSLVEQFFTPAA